MNICEEEFALHLLNIQIPQRKYLHCRNEMNAKLH